MRALAQAGGEPIRKRTGGKPGTPRPRKTTARFQVFPRPPFLPPQHNGPTAQMAGEAAKFTRRRPDEMTDDEAGDDDAASR